MDLDGGVALMDGEPAGGGGGARGRAHVSNSKYMCADEPTTCCDVEGGGASGETAETGLQPDRDRRRAVVTRVQDGTSRPS